MYIINSLWESILLKQLAAVSYVAKGFPLLLLILARCSLSFVDFFLPPAVRALVRFFLDCRLRLLFTVVLYPEPFIISDILSAAFLLRLRPDSLARDFTASLKLTLLLATSSTTFIPARSVSLPTALAPLVTYGRMRQKRPPNQASTPRPLWKVEPAKTFLTPPRPICS